MIIKRKTWKDQTWCALSFPRVNRTILWNDTLKTYDIYEGLIDGKGSKAKSTKSLKSAKKERESTNPITWRCLCYALAGGLGVALAVIICLISFR